MKENRKALFSDLLFLTIILVFLWVSFISYQRISQLNEAHEWITHTNLIKLKLEEVISDLKDAETSQRGFLLTKDSTFLPAYANAVTETKKITEQIEVLTLDNKSQHEKANELKRLVEKRLSTLQEVINLSKNSTKDLTSYLLDGKKLMNEVRVLNKFMIQNEDYLLAERTKQKDKSAAITPWYTLLLSLAAVLVVVIAYFRMRMEKNLRYKAEDSEAAVQNYFIQVPAMVAILKGPDHRYEFANPAFEKLFGQTDFIGKTVFETIPELKDEAFREILKNVYHTGQPFIGNEIKITSELMKTEKEKYINLILQSYKNIDGNIEGILVFGYDVSEQVFTRKKIEEVELRSRLAIEAAQMGTFDWNIITESIVTSPKLLEIFGYPKDHPITHLDFVSALHPDDKAARDIVMKEAFAKGSVENEARIVRPDKSVRWIRSYGKIIYDDKKQPVRMYGMTIDITQQKLALYELKESESKFRLLADSMPQLIWTSNAKGELSYFNNAMYTFSGLDKNILEKEGWLGIVHPDEKKLSAIKWNESVTNGTEFIIEHRFLDKNGEYRWQLSRAIPQKDAEGNIQMWVGTSTDIDEQKNFSTRLQQMIDERTSELAKLNRELKLQNNIFSQAEENARIGSYSWNLGNGQLEYSDNLYRLLGHEPGEFVPSFEKYLTFIHPDDLEQVIKDGRETMETKKLNEHVHRIYTKNGELKYFRSSGKIYGEGEYVNLIGTVQDVSNDIRLNEMLREQNLQLERSNTELESFNYIASHDLQEPLRKIQAFSHRILEKDKDKFSETTMDYFGRITKAASRMQNLIDALISYSKNNNAEEETRSTDLNILMEHVKESLIDSIEETKAVIMSDQLPVLNVIPVQFQQLFINLVSNAIKYRKKDTAPHINIRAQLMHGKDIREQNANKNIQYWKISVSDNGIGFEQKYQTKIFELFQRLHSNAEYQGTGIGLAICSKIVRNHDGIISAEGIPNEGATFNIYIPVIE